jgi:hypothetical protein
MGNKLLSIFAGTLVAMFVIGGIEQVVHVIFPLPMTVTQPVLPLGFFPGLLIGYVLGCVAGGLTAALIAQQNKQRMGLSVGVVVLAGGIINFMILPHPLWFVICSVLIYLPSAFIGGVAGSRLRKQKAVLENDTII